MYKRSGFEKNRKCKKVVNNLWIKSGNVRSGEKLEHSIMTVWCEVNIVTGSTPYKLNFSWHRINKIWKGSKFGGVPSSKKSKNIRQYFRSENGWCIELQWLLYRQINAKKIPDASCMHIWVKGENSILQMSLTEFWSLFRFCRPLLNWRRL